MLSGPLDAHDAALSSNAFGTTPKKELGEDPCIRAGGLAERPAGSRLADPHSEVLDSGLLEGSADR